MSSLSTFGYTAAGLQIMRQSDWQALLEADWQAAFGANVNLSPTSNNGQIIGIMAERLALVSELIEAVNAANTVAGAEGVAVDNILALNGLKRLPATYTTTQNTPVTGADGVTIYGLVFYGTPGTVVAAGTLVADSQSPPNVFVVDAPGCTIQPPVNAQQTLVFSNKPDQGSFSLVFTTADATTVATPAIAFNAAAQNTQLVWANAPTSGSFTLFVDGMATAAIAYNATADAIAGAINAVLGTTTVTASGNSANGINVIWPASSIPFVKPSADASAPQVINSVQACVNSLMADNIKPFTDVAVSAAGSTLTFAFGACAPQANQPSTAASAQSLITTQNNTLKAGNAYCNLALADTVQGAAAQAIGTATSQNTGPATVKANTLTVMQTPVSGVASVTNPLDCISGSNTETDEQALLRRSGLLAAGASGPLNAILESVRQINGVSQALAFQNLNNAAQQLIAFGTLPSQGSFQLSVGPDTTAAIAGTCAASDVAAALQALPGYASATVSGSAASGFQVDWGAANGGQAIPQMVVSNNTTGTTIDVRFGRPPKSVEIVAAGGEASAIAKAIYLAAPAGIATYSAPVLVTLAQVSAGSPNMSLVSTENLEIGHAVTCFGVPQGATVVGIQGNVAVLSSSALSSYSNVTAVFNNAVLLSDSNDNPVLVGFSRPVPVPIFVTCNLITDEYLTPGVPASGINPSARWTPTAVTTIQNDLLAIGNAIPIGGLVVGFGSNGLVGAFNSTVGVVSYNLSFGTTASPTGTANIQMLPEQVPAFDSSNILISYS